MIQLTVDGRLYEGWISAQVDRGLQSFAHSFRLQYLDRWSQRATPWPILSGAECVVSWAGQQLIHGYVDTPSFQVDSEQWSMAAQGRSRTGDLVDCSAVHKTGHWTQAKADKIIRELCEPFGIGVTVAPGVDVGEAFKRFALREGEKVHAAMDRLCKVRGLLPVTTADGDVELWTSDGTLDTPIPLDVEMALSRSYRDDSSVRYSDYLVRSNDYDNPDATRGEVSDSFVSRWRPMVVVGDAPARTKEAERRAQWEANVRSARGERVVYTFNSPLNIDGNVYAPRQIYAVYDEYLGIDVNLMVELVTIAVRESALEVNLSLVLPDAFSQKPLEGEKMVTQTKRAKRVEGTAARRGFGLG